MATWNKLNVDATALTTGSTGTSNKSLFIGNYQGVIWSAVQTALYYVAIDSMGPFPSVYMNLRALLDSATGAGYKAGDINNSGSIDTTDRNILANYINNTATTAQVNWINTYIRDPILANISLYVAEGGATSSPVASIYGGANSNVLADPTGNASKIFFDTRYDYLRIKKIVDFTITLPARTRRATGGGKKSGTGFLSYNGYADFYIYQHDYGNPPPAFTVFVKGDAGNGAIANHGITGSIPIQFVSPSSFRLALVYSTDKYLVLRERYQVYSDDIPGLTLTVRAHFFENPTSVTARTPLMVTHSPTTFEIVSTDPYVWSGGKPPAGSAAPRYCHNTISWTTQLGQTYNKITVDRNGGKPTQWSTGVGVGHYIDMINGVAVTPFDPYTTPQSFTYTGSFNTWSMRVNTVTNGPRIEDFTPSWRVRFENTVTGAIYDDFVGGIHRFIA